MIIKVFWQNEPAPATIVVSRTTVCRDEERTDFTRRKNETSAAAAVAAANDSVPRGGRGVHRGVISVHPEL